MNFIKNQVQLVGNVGNDPEVKNLDSGKVVANFSIATNENYTNKEGEKVTDTTWHDIVAWGKTADLVEKLIKKGTPLIISGKLTNRTYDDPTRGKIKVTEILLNEFFITETKKD